MCSRSLLLLLELKVSSHLLPSKDLDQVSLNPKSNSTVHEQYIVLPPKHSSPIQTIKASSTTFPPSEPQLSNSHSMADPIEISANQNSSLPLSPNSNPAQAPVQVPVNPLAASLPPSSQPAPKLVDRIRKSEAKTLQRLAPVTISDTCRPRVFIPDEVLQQGAELHKDFIACYFNGRPPPFKQIQNVLDHLWGKGRRVEIHNNPLTRSMLVCIPSDYLRQKILEKCIWYVGDSMFHTVQWTSAHSSSTPPLVSIPIWAHLHGVPLDLRHKRGLSLVAGLVGEPKETNDFTKNLVSLTISHVKVAVDLTKPLPEVVEFTRQSGEVIEVAVTYPWIPPACSHYKEIGHIAKNCLLLPPPVQQQQTKKPVPSTSTKGKGKAASSDNVAASSVKDVETPLDCDH